jgi:hypothetical protein
VNGGVTIVTDRAVGRAGPVGRRVLPYESRERVRAALRRIGARKVWSASLPPLVARCSSPATRRPRFVARIVSPAVAVLSVVPLACTWGCLAPRMVSTARGPQAYYQTAFPEHDTSRELARTFASVKQISFTAEYRTYLFPAEAGITEEDVRSGRFRARADSSFPESLSKAGTATIIARSGTHVTLLTTDHVVHLPALRISYYDEGPGRSGAAGPRRVASASVRTSQRGTLVPHPGRGPLEVLARDEHNDLALLGMELGELSDTTLFPPLALRTGDSKRLSWGSFLYVLGYPAGYRMVTRSIVSNPNWDGRGGFISDGLWNEGISGGLILAIRGETGALEPVGLARAGAATSELRLQPDTLSAATAGETRRYEGMLYVESVLRIQYGITLPVSMTAVSDFLERNRAALRARGYF